MKIATAFLSDKHEMLNLRMILARGLKFKSFATICFYLSAFNVDLFGIFSVFISCPWLFLSVPVHRLMTYLNKKTSPLEDIHFSRASFEHLQEKEEKHHQNLTSLSFLQYVFVHSKEFQDQAV